MSESKSVSELNHVELDVLKEIGNIGAGNATTSLAKMLNRNVDMYVPKVQIVEFKYVSDILGGGDHIVVANLVQVAGDISGYMMFILGQDYAYSLLNMLMGKEVRDISELTEIDMSAFSEIGNILIGSYLTSISALTGLKMKPSIPSLTIDMAGAVLSVPAIEFGKIGEQVLFIETEFCETNKAIRGNFFLIPDVDSYHTILKALGVVS